MLEFEKKFFKKDVAKKRAIEEKKVQERMKMPYSFCEDGVLYIFDKEKGNYVEEHDVIDDIISLWEEKDKEQNRQ